MKIQNNNKQTAVKKQVEKSNMHMDHVNRDVDDLDIKIENFANDEVESDGEDL